MADDYRKYWDPLAMTQAMPANEKQIRDKFIAEYVKDNDLYLAAIRAGYVADLALEEGKKLLNDIYVQQQLMARKLAIPENPKEERKLNIRKVEAGLWEIALNKFQKGQTRVAALSRLANIYEMDGATKIKGDFTHKGGIMVVPGISNVDDWEKQAAAQQDKLITDSAEDRSGKSVH